MHAVVEGLCVGVKSYCMSEQLAQILLCGMYSS
jgi:hypothetical protein